MLESLDRSQKGKDNKGKKGALPLRGFPGQNKKRYEVAQKKKQNEKRKSIAEKKISAKTRKEKEKTSPVARAERQVLPRAKEETLTE